MNKIWRVIIDIQLIGVVIGFLLNQWVFEDNKIKEARIDIRRDLISSTHEQLNQLDKLIELSNHKISYKTETPFIKDIVIFEFENKDTLTVDINGDKVKVYKGHPNLYLDFFTYKFYYYPTDYSLPKTEISIMNLAVNSVMKNEWYLLAESVKTKKYTVDKNILEKFEQLEEFLKYNPFPTSKAYDKITQSSWNKDTEEKWVVLNTELKEGIRKFEGFEM